MPYPFLIPVENDVEYLFVEGLYFTWKASGDSAWMKSCLDAAIQALDYSLESPYRWSEKYGLLKRGYITVTGCTLVSTSSGLILGAECREPIRNVIFDACTIRSSHRGLAVHLSEESDIENVLFSNMIVETRLFHEKWWGRAEPIYITAIPWTGQHKIGHVHHIRFTNILARSENGAFIQGWEKDRVEDILLENVRIEIDKWSKWPAGRHDIRPCPAEGLPEHPTAGFFVQNAREVTLRNCQVVWGQNRPESFRYALEARSVDNLALENFRGGAAHPEKYAAWWIE